MFFAVPNTFSFINLADAQKKCVYHCSVSITHQYRVPPLHLLPLWLCWSCTSCCWSPGDECSRRSRRPFPRSGRYCGTGQCLPEQRAEQRLSGKTNPEKMWNWKWKKFIFCFTNENQFKDSQFTRHVIFFRIVKNGIFRPRKNLQIPKHKQSYALIFNNY